MYQRYDDILTLLSGHAVRWWDECGVPRYCPFAPAKVANSYAREALLLWIECASCNRKFAVAMTSDAMAMVQGEKSLADKINDGTLSYGDPPNVGCCAAGPTMSSDSLAVLQYWKREHLTWERVGTLERALVYNLATEQGQPLAVRFNGGPWDGCYRAMPHPLPPEWHVPPPRSPRCSDYVGARMAKYVLRFAVADGCPDDLRYEYEPQAVFEQ